MFASLFSNTKFKVYNFLIANLSIYTYSPYQEDEVKIKEEEEAVPLTHLAHSSTLEQEV